MFIIKWLYVKFTGKCPYDKTVLYDPSVAGNSKIRECGKCGRYWNT